MINSSVDRYKHLLESFNIPLEVYGEISEAIEFIEKSTEEPHTRYQMLKRELMRIWIGGEPIADIDIMCSDGEWFEKIHPSNAIRPKMNEVIDQVKSRREYNTPPIKKRTK